MSPVAFDLIRPEVAPLRLPLELDQRHSRMRTLCLALLLLPAVLALLLPAALALWLIAMPAVGNHASQASPMALAQLLLLPWIAGGLCWLPLKAVLWRVSRSRQVMIAADRVTVRETGLTGSTTWQAPITEFRGIAHNIRSSLSGTRHELILVHPQALRSVLLHFADQLPQSVIDCYSQLLGVPEVTSRELHRLDPDSATWLPQVRFPGGARA